MGLAEKRAIEEFKKGGYATFANKISEITKFDLVLEANWDEIAAQMDGRAADIPQYFNEMFATSLTESLQSICADDMGREALRGLLKKVQFKCDAAASYNEQGFSLSNGVLTMNMTWTGNSVGPRTTALTALIEKAL